MSDSKGIALLGSTGSIGTQTLDVVSAFPDRFRVVALAGHHSAETIAEQARQHRPRLVALADEAAAAQARDYLKDLPIEVAAGPQAVIQCALHPEADVVMAAASGIAGLPPVWEAVRAGKTVALANKEPLVVAGHLLLPEAARSRARLLPVDSEHSAVFQLLLGQHRAALRRVILTASGGAFRDLPADRLDCVTPKQALSHPTWKMGPKVTVDSATLMNKGLELMEARWLFGLDPGQLDVVLHPESIVHGLVEFADGSLLAQLARPDMRLPIQFALSYPDRLPRPEPPLDLTQLAALHFGPVPRERYPCLRLAEQALAAGGTAPACLNAADEVAVDWFLQGHIKFTRIPDIVERGLNASHDQTGDSIESLLSLDRQVRQQLEREKASWTTS